MLVLLLLLSMFIQIDAVGEQVNPFNAFVATDDPTDAEIARSQVLESLRAAVANRDQNPGVYSPVVNRLLDMFVNAANRDQENQVADLVVQAYNRFNQELERRGVQMPPLNQLGAEPRIDVSTFRNVGLQANGQPFSSLDAFILQVFNPEITTQRAINVQPLNEANRSNSPYRSPIKYQPSTPLQANEGFQGEGLPGAGAALVTPENISRASRRLFASPPLVTEVQPGQEVGQSPQGFSTPPTNAGQTRTAGQARLAGPAQGRNVRPRLNRDTTPTNQLYWVPPRRDDENGPDGGGVPVE